MHSMQDVDERAGPDTARAALTAWLDKIGKNTTWLGRTLGYRPSTAWRWLSDVIPDDAGRRALEILTGGAVRAAWWRTSDEWALIDRAKEARLELTNRGRRRVEAPS